MMNLAAARQASSVIVQVTRLETMAVANRAVTEWCSWVNC